ncbi:MAG: hypothetical protein U0670_12130 [Anaerolineae bacterium]
MAALPIRAMVLYKHGVGFFVRAGSVSGTSAALTFKSEEINDVLKSLTVFDQAGGQVTGVHYPTPIPHEERLSTSSIKLSDLGSLRDLLVQLRGRMVTVTARTETAETLTLEGRMIGIDQPPSHSADAPLDQAATRVLILTATGVHVFQLGDLVNFTVHDETINSDLTYFLDTTSSDDRRRVVTLRLSEGDHDLVVQYVAPSPLWRVSYRLLVDVAESGEITAGLLQGWGVFDNRFEEDLDGVALTLVAGQPISFVYDLSESQIPQRPTIRDQARVAPIPVEYNADTDTLADFIADGQSEMPMRKAAAPAPMPQTAAARGGGFGGRLPVLGSGSTAFPPPARQFREQAPAQAEGKEAGEFFEYHVTTPISVKRGESALVPLFNADVQPTRELLYNAAKLPDHPVAALHFKNTSGLSFERGPVTLIESGDYKGEAIIPFTRGSADVYVPYAVELAVQVTLRSETHYESYETIQIEGSWYAEQSTRQTHTYTFENTLQRPVTITLERAITSGYDLVDTAAPEVETAHERRWLLAMESRSRRTFVINERMITRTLLVNQRRSWWQRLINGLGRLFSSGKRR